jgi:hypothetical protein
MPSHASNRSRVFKNEAVLDGDKEVRQMGVRPVASTLTAKSITAPAKLSHLRFQFLGYCLCALELEIMARALGLDFNEQMFGRE